MTDAITCNSSRFNFKPDNNIQVNLKALESKLEKAQDEQGIFGKAWNGIKEATGIGTSESKCEGMLEKYKKGTVSFEEAVNYIDQYKAKQDNTVNLFSNIVTGVASIASTVIKATGPVGWAISLAVGAPLGALTKSGVKFIERATNNVKNDEYDTKAIVKDAVSGAVTGFTSALPSHIGAGIKAKNIGTSVFNGAKCGAFCGALSGSIGYTTDALLGEHDFEINEMLKDTAVSAVTSAGIGGLFGGGMYENAAKHCTLGMEVAKSKTQTIVTDASLSSARKVAGDIADKFGC